MKTKALIAIAGALILTALPIRTGNLVDGEVFRVNEVCAAWDISLPCYPAFDICFIWLDPAFVLVVPLWKNLG